ncbi:MAG: NAD(P)/FAD-dependent oxidoreductase [Actinobacteria bacterium]|nr:MAG: NAD(P)/FAD-dependent oxidoreductase [Actinomycetota bacterium]
MAIPILIARAERDTGETMRAEEHHDVVIVGAGAAGVSCALECYDIQLDTVVFESKPEPGGQLAEIPHSVRNVAAGRFENGRALRRALEESSAILGDRLRVSHSALRADLGERWVEANGTRIHGKALVVCTGTARQNLPAAVDGAFGGDVTYQLEPRRDRFVGRDVVVIGSGDSAALDALELAATASSVRLVHRSGTLTARHDIVEQVRGEPRIEDLPGRELEKTTGGDRLEEIVLVRSAGGERLRLRVGGVIVKIARVPCTHLFQGQIELDRAGAIIVDSELRTSRDGVLAAGDVTAGSYPRVATALGQGVLAARSALRYVQGRP